MQLPLTLSIVRALLVEMGRGVCVSTGAHQSCAQVAKKDIEVKPDGNIFASKIGKSVLSRLTIDFRRQGRQSLGEQVPVVVIGTKQIFTAS